MSDVPSWQRAQQSAAGRVLPPQLAAQVPAELREDEGWARPSDGEETLARLDTGSSAVHDDDRSRPVVVVGVAATGPVLPSAAPAGPSAVVRAPSADSSPTRGVIRVEALVRLDDLTGLSAWGTTRDDRQPGMLP